MNHNKKVLQTLLANKNTFKPVLPFNFSQNVPVVFDLSKKNQILLNLNFNDIEMFSDYIFSELGKMGTPVGIGCYAEDRIVYRHRKLFDEAEEKRSLHMGIDIFVQPGTPVYAPLDSLVHSVANNKTPGDYGPTIILQHQLNEITFFSLYGHLSIDSLDNLDKNQSFTAGEKIGTIGKTQENGGWPPHLHFQVITDIGQWQGDFPGVVTPSQLEHYMELCPNPNLILNIPVLNENGAIK